MPAAARAEHLGADHPVADVSLFLDRRRIERGPTATRVVLRLRSEQLRSATRAPVGAGLEGEVVLPGERGLGSLFAQNPVLLRRQLATPLLLCFLNFRHR